MFLKGLPHLKSVKKAGKSKTRFLDVSASFDIEVTSFYLDEMTGETLPTSVELPKKDIGKRYKRRACMYAWVFTLGGYATIGRTWEEFLALLREISGRYGLGKELVLPVYVHNLSYEMQFLLHRLNWTKVFAIAEREPIYARCDLGIEFRCSLKLSGYSLKITGENLRRHKMTKADGDLDYLMLRHSKTPLTHKEEGYLVRDGLVVADFIQEQREDYGSIAKIPLTKTGIVRKYLRDECLYGGKSHSLDYGHKRERYLRLMKWLSLEKDEYILARHAFQGGLVHCSAINEGVIHKDVTSIDFTSSYPYHLIAYKYPTGTGKKYVPKSIQDFERIIRIRGAIFYAEFFDIEAREMFEHVISTSKCIVIDEPVIDNGRLVSAKKIRIAMTSVDYIIYKRFYSWSRMSVGLMYVYQMNYLPTSFVKAIVSLYKDKTTLKDVDDELSKARYQWAKEQLNSVYGCCVTAVSRPTIKLTDGVWGKEEGDLEKDLAKYNEDPTRFNSYLWGVFCTAFARLSLCTGIIEAGKSFDYVYCDTDSVKMTNFKDHEGYVRKYNEDVEKRLRKACRHHGIPFDDVAPKTIKGVTKMLGQWDIEYHAKRFKALRAKCYMAETEKGFTITIAGVSKKTAVPKLLEMAKERKKGVFDLVDWDFEFDRDACGKNLHTYIDEPTEGILIDYEGNAGEYEELSSVHLEATTYNLNAGDEYLDFLSSIREISMIGE